MLSVSQAAYMGRSRATVQIISVALLLLSVGCGYFVSGTWEDDPKNYKRAWGYSKPQEIDLVHSWYWRAPHWTREEAYFFEFRWNKDLFEQFRSYNNLRPVTPNNIEGFCFPKPPWFAPKSPASYDAWSCESSHDCLMLRATATQELFIYACQL